MLEERRGSVARQVCGRAFFVFKSAWAGHFMKNGRRVTYNSKYQFVEANLQVIVAVPVCTKRNLFPPNVQQLFLSQGALFPGRHKPVPEGLTAAVLAADTRESTLSLRNWDTLSFRGNQKEKTMAVMPIFTRWASRESS